MVRSGSIFAIAGVCLLLVGCGGGRLVLPASSVAAVPSLRGAVHGGQQPIYGATIQLYAVNTATNAGASTALITGTTVTTAAGSACLALFNATRRNGIHSSDTVVAACNMFVMGQNIPQTFAVSSTQENASATVYPAAIQYRASFVPQGSYPQTLSYSGSIAAQSFVVLVQ